jgi:hypothetical protein
VKTALRGKKFQDVEEIKKKVTAELNAVPLKASAVSKNFCKDSQQTNSSWRRLL